MLKDWRSISRNFLVVFADFRVVFVLLEILELFEYLVAKYSLFEDELFLLELETLLLSNSDMWQQFINGWLFNKLIINVRLSKISGRNIPNDDMLDLL